MGRIVKGLNLSVKDSASEPYLNQHSDLSPTQVNTASPNSGEEGFRNEKKQGKKIKIFNMFFISNSDS